MADNNPPGGIPVVQSRRARDAARTFTAIPTTRRPGSPVLDNGISLPPEKQRVMTAVLDALVSVPGADADTIRQNFATLARQSGSNAFNVALTEYAAAVAAGTVPQDNRNAVETAIGTNSMIRGQLSRATALAEGRNPNAAAPRPQELPVVAQRGPQQQVMTALVNALANANGADPDAVRRRFAELQRASGSNAFNTAITEFAQASAAGSIQAADAQAVTAAIGNNAAIMGQFSRAMNAATGNNPNAAEPRPQELPVVAQRGPQQQVMTALVNALANANGADPDAVRRRFAELQRASGSNAFNTAITEFAQASAAGSIQAADAQAVTAAIGNNAAIMGQLSRAMNAATGNNPNAAAPRPQQLPNTVLRTGQQAVMDAMIDSLAEVPGFDAAATRQKYADLIRTQGNAAFRVVMADYAGKLANNGISLANREKVETALAGNLMARSQWTAQLMTMEIRPGKRDAMNAMIDAMANANPAQATQVRGRYTGSNEAVFQRVVSDYAAALEAGRIKADDRGKVDDVLVGKPVVQDMLTAAINAIRRPLGMGAPAAAVPPVGAAIPGAPVAGAAIPGAPVAGAAIPGAPRMGAGIPAAPVAGAAIPGAPRAGAGVPAAPPVAGGGIPVRPRVPGGVGVPIVPHHNGFVPIVPHHNGFVPIVPHHHGLVPIVPGGRNPLPVAPGGRPGVIPVAPGGRNPLPVAPGGRPGEIPVVPGGRNPLPVAPGGRPGEIPVVPGGRNPLPVAPGGRPGEIPVVPGGRNPLPVAPGGRPGVIPVAPGGRNPLPVAPGGRPGVIPVAPGGRNPLPVAPGGRPGVIPVAPGGRNPLPVAPGGRPGMIPVAPGGRGALPVVPGGRGGLPVVPGGRGGLPVVPGGRGGLPVVPGGRGGLPVVPGGRGGLPVVPGGRHGIPVSMHTEDEHLLDELAETTALAMGIPVEDVLAPAAGLRTDEQIRSVMAQYAIARSTGRNPAEMEVPVMRQADMRTAQLAATLMNAMPKGVKDNMSDDDRRRAVTLAMQNPRQFEVFVDSVRGARGNRAMERAATDVLKANIGAGNIALASTGISGGETTNGPNGRRAMTGFDTSTNPNDRQLS